MRIFKPVSILLLCGLASLAQQVSNKAEDSQMPTKLITNGTVTKRGDL